VPQRSQENDSERVKHLTRPLALLKTIKVSASEDLKWSEENFIAECKK
jgi:hypothetical protein